MDETEDDNASTDIQTHTASIHVRVFTFLAVSAVLFPHFRAKNEHRYLPFLLCCVYEVMKSSCDLQGRNETWEWDDVARERVQV